MPKHSAELVTTAIMTLVVSFVLLVHNGQEPLFLTALACMPVVAIVAYWRRSLWPIVLYLLIFGGLGRYTRYFRQGYMSDTLPAIQDYIGYLLAGNNVYAKIIMAQSGPTPFTYLPFALLWYLPARLLTIDLRFMEMVVSAAVPLLYFLYGKIKGVWSHLPLVAVIALTPFLLDLSADGSNDNSAIFLLLAALVLFAYAQVHKSRRAAIVSAIVLAASCMFKHYLMFFLLFFLPYVWRTGGFPLRTKTYLLLFFAGCAALSLPFILASPGGFYKSLVFIEIGNFHHVWGWNIWVALRGVWAIVATRQQMWLVRTVGTIVTIGVLFVLRPQRSLVWVYIASSVSLLVYLVLSDWTTYAYFTFLVPLAALAAVPEVDGRKSSARELMQ